MTAPDFDPIDWIRRYVDAGGGFSRVADEIWFGVPDRAFESTRPILAELKAIEGARARVRATLDARP